MLLLPRQCRLRAPDVRVSTTPSALSPPLEQEAARDRQKAAASANKAEAFTCCVCMDRLPLADLRVNAPCGHAFCKTCITPSHALSGTPAECFSCRGNVASVLQTFV